MKRILLLALPLLIASCGMKVTTDIQKTLPPRVTAEKVHIYNVIDTVPTEAEYIGNISVRDGGLTTNCGINRVVELAKNKTADCGGNILQLTHLQRPSKQGSSCHQIEGNMLWMPDTLNWDSAYNAEPTIAIIDKTSPKIECGHIITNKYLSPHTFYGAIGRGFITTEIDALPNNDHSVINGLDWTLGYDWQSKKGWGLGLKYSGYYSSSTTRYGDFDLSITYIAPQYIMELVKNQWIYEAHLGLGYLNYDETSDFSNLNISGLGANIDLSVERFIAPKVSIFLNVGYVGGFMDGINTNLPVPQGGSTLGGIFRLNILAGIKLHFDKKQKTIK